MEGPNILFDRTSFYEDIMKHVKKDDLTIFEAILEICKEHKLDPEDVTPFIQGPLKEKLKVELINRNMLHHIKRGNTLAGI